VTTQLDLPLGWSSATLGDVAEVIRGVTYRKGDTTDAPQEGFVPLLRSGNIGSDLLLTEKLVYVPRELVRDEQMLRAGDIVVSTSNSRELVGKSASLTHPWQGTFGAFCSVVRPSSAVDADFVALFLQSPMYRRVIAQLSAATNNIANIRVSHLTALELPLPTIEVQRLIVQRVRALRTQVSEGAQRFRLALAGLTKYQASCLGAAFSGGPIRLLDELAYVQSGIAKGRPGDGDLIEMPYIRTANVQAGYLDLDVIKTLDVTEQQREKHLLQDQDVLVLEGGDADKVGRGWIWESQIPGCLHQNHVFAVRTGEVLRARFLAHYLNSPQARRYFLSCAKQTTNLASINKRQLRALPVPVPPLSEQDDAIALLDAQLAAARRETASLRSQLSWADQLDASILHSALGGQLTDTSSTDRERQLAGARS
jgi:type I restriction enzyme, S subunit